MLHDRVKRVLELRNQINQLDEELRELRDYFLNNFSVIVDARDLEEGTKELYFPVDDFYHDKVCLKTRPIRSCSFELLKSIAPEVYERVVFEGETTYVEFRRIHEMER